MAAPLAVDAGATRPRCTATAATAAACGDGGGGRGGPAERPRQPRCSDAGQAGRSAAGWSEGTRWAPRPPPEERKAALASAGQSDAMQLAAEATRAHSEVTVPYVELLDLPEKCCLERLRALMRRIGDDEDCYVGSTSDPRWRWEGGWYYPSDDEAGAHQKFMPGHRLKWNKMVILGAWPDAETARLEPIAIKEARLFSDNVQNKVEDARGLAKRSRWCYSFIYACM